MTEEKWDEARQKEWGEVKEEEEMAKCVGRSLYVAISVLQMYRS